MRILLVEDDLLLGKATRAFLEEEGHAVDWVERGNDADTALRTHEYGAVLLDLGLPDTTGGKLLRMIRSRRQVVPVLIITARDRVTDRIEGLDAGADDFIVKPYDLDELSARIRAVCRRAAGRAQRTIVHGRITLDPLQSCLLDGRPVPLTPRELALLTDLMEHRGQLRSRGQLEQALYGWGGEVESNSIEVHIHHLRRKLGKDLIQTAHRIGYRIALPSAAGHVPAQADAPAHDAPPADSRDGAPE